ncbi:RNA methyltransferase [Hyphomicrobium sp. D-2]|uniref:TrmH family RNA methyltransferase n=1 Tax=Hyphomicrobium sp. D-2 TaxID=3041621 RepID=UPI002453D666|nr:RNA methyltransferase [Hyphomicrobium sp. D-2]MDH4983907.1 RNA methyltransferase [Hyphomicrobium sp. D-2]
MLEPKPITSLQNERIKAIRALEMRKTRKETGLFVAEGTSLLITARDNGFKPQTLVFRSGSAGSGVAKGLVSWALASGVECLEVSEAVLGKLSSKDNPQNMLSVFQQRWQPLPNATKVSGGEVWLALEEVRDPGNLGTIIRTADAVGAAGIILIGNCCDPYSHECVRATMGSVFAVPLVRTERAAFIDWLGGWRGDIVGTHLEGAEDFRTASYRAPVLLTMGSEGPGLSPQLTAACTRLVKIPMAGQLDSLNLAVATALVLYQIRGPNLSL